MARRITQQQKNRIVKIHAKRVQRLQEGESQNALSLGPEQEGIIVAHYGAYVDIEASDGQIYRCNLRQNLKAVVPGDKVVWQLGTDNTGVLVAVLPRKSLLSRFVDRGKEKPIAANLDQVILVFALQPKPAANVIDSYLIALETLKLQVIMVCNKRDLLAAENDDDILNQIKLYQKIGYPVLFTSIKTHEGLQELSACLRGQTSVFVGQSGVGKSSLISSLLPEYSAAIATAKAAHATHTTTTARLYHLPVGGELIDSPGVRDFVLWNMSSAAIAAGFIEFQPYLQRCQFRDCLHLNEPNCAIRDAVEQQLISLARYNSYKRLVA